LQRALALRYFVATAGLSKNLLREWGEITMSDFRTYQRAKRIPAIPMQRIIDPAGWDPKPTCLSGFGIRAFSPESSRITRP